MVDCSGLPVPEARRKGSLAVLDMESHRSDPGAGTGTGQRSMLITGTEAAAKAKKAARRINKAQCRAIFGRFMSVDGSTEPVQRSRRCSNSAGN